MGKLPYSTISASPEEISAANAIARMVDAIGFRYQAALEDITDLEMTFRPCESSFNFFELLQHIYDLSFITNKTFGGENKYRKEELTDFSQLRHETLRLYKEASDLLKLMKNEELEKCNVQPKSLPDPYPFWYVINGHIADALTHIGQLVTWRRIARNPQPKTNVFLGKKFD